MYEKLQKRIRNHLLFYRLTHYFFNYALIPSLATHTGQILVVRIVVASSYHLSCINRAENITSCIPILEK